jgi:hypothetical protein
MLWDAYDVFPLKVGRAAATVVEVARAVDHADDMSIRRFITKCQGLGERIHILIGVLSET